MQYFTKVVGTGVGNGERSFKFFVGLENVGCLQFAINLQTLIYLYVKKPYLVTEIIIFFGEICHQKHEN